MTVDDLRKRLEDIPGHWAIGAMFRPGSTLELPDLTDEDGTGSSWTYPADSFDLELVSIERGPDDAGGSTFRVVVELSGGCF